MYSYYYGMPVKKDESEYIGSYTNKEFRQRHKAYIMRKVTCKCGTEITYCNMSHHKHTTRHINAMKEIENDPDYIDELGVLVNDISKLCKGLDEEEKLRAYALLKKAKKDIKSFSV